MKALAAFLEKEPVKIALSALIFVSLLPTKGLDDAVAHSLSLAFFAIFSIELAIRAAAFVPAVREGKASRWEIPLFILDLAATLSFLPVEAVFPAAHGLRALRLFRLIRLVMLLRFWGHVGRETWVILAKRRYQILFAASLVAILLFAGGAVLSNLMEMQLAGAAGDGNDLNEDGASDDRDREFGTVLWWVFRQILDPGNLVASPSGGILLVFSLILTLGGVFILSFIIGIGASVVEELVLAGRSRPIGMSDHNAVLNIGPSSHLLLSELESYYRKHLRKAMLAVLGPWEARPDYLYRPELRAVRYRHGDASDVDDLRKVDADRAKRVILLGDADDPGTDARVVSQILSVRQLNPGARIVAEIHDDSNLPAAVEAGGADTVPVPVGTFAGLFLANIVRHPGMEDVYRDLLTPEGLEIYSAVYGDRVLAPLPAGVRPMGFEQLFDAGLERYGVLLLGVVELAKAGEPWSWNGLVPRLNPDPLLQVDGSVRGFVGLSDRFEDLRALAADFAAGRVRQAGASQPRDGAPEFRTCPSSSAIRRILVLNFREGLADFVEEISLSLPGVEVLVMAGSEGEARNVEEILLSHSRRLASSAATARRRFERDGDWIAYGPGGGADPRARVRAFAGDASDLRHFLDPSGAPRPLLESDVVVFTPRSGSKDPDAQTALGLLKLWNMHRDRPELFKPEFRIVAEVADPDRGELLGVRALASKPPAGRCRVVTVLSREWIRNEFLAQAIFVPGLSAVYGRLLTCSGQELCRLLPELQGTDAESRWSFQELLRAVYRRDRLILLGVEVADPDSGVRALKLNPGRGEPGYRFRLRDLVSVSAVGDSARFAGGRGGCRRCLTRPGLGHQSLGQ